MPRKSRKTAPPKLPLSVSEVWEIGQRPLAGLVPSIDVAISELPTMLFVVQADSGDPIFGTPVMPDAPLSDLVVHARQAMREPMIGEPRRPAVIRVSSEAEASVLRTGLDEADMTIEVTEVLKAVDDAHAMTMRMFGNVQSDYRTHVEATGDTLSDAALRALYVVAQQFYRKALWEEFDDSEMFSVAFQTADGQTQAHYGILMGIMEEKFGLALYASLDDLQQIYEMDIDALEDFALPLDEDEDESEVWEAGVDMAAQLLSVPSVSLTYTPKREIPPPLVDEAKALKLPVAKQSAYPLMMRTGQGIELANLTDLRLLFIALHAILAWDKQVETLDLEDELDETLTVEIPAMADAHPALTAEVTLVVNPFIDDGDLIDMDDEDEPLVSIDPERMRELFDPALLDELATSDTPPRSSQGRSSSAANPTGGQSPTSTSDQVYTLKVFLTSGPVDAFEEEEISREILLLGHHTLHDLHSAIFDAFERWESHLYEFNLGSGPQDRSRLYFYHGDGGNVDEDAEDPTTTVLDELDLTEGQFFGYTFDMGDDWEHVIEVISMKRGPGKGTYPRIGKKVGAAPPQYPDDEDEDFE